MQDAGIPQDREKKQLVQSVLPGLVLAGVMWLVKVLESLSGSDWGRYGLYPKEMFGVKGILTMPFLHGDYSHLMANTIPVVVLLTFININYKEVAAKIVGWTVFATGLWTWSFARPAFHIGASGLVYGLISFVLMSGFIRRDRASLALSFLVIFLYGGFIWGMLPQGGNISWEGHLSGGVAGLIFAFAFSKPEPEDEVQETIDEALPVPDNVSSSGQYIYFIPPSSSQNPEVPPQNFHLNYIYYDKAETNQAKPEAPKAKN